MYARVRPHFVPIAGIVFLLSADQNPARAWDEEGHVIVTRLAFRSLPPSMPDWMRTPRVQARLEYLSAEPDRWRGQNHVQLDHINNPDHYIDEELLHPYGLSLKRLPPLRRQFTDILAEKVALNPVGFDTYDASGDEDYTRRSPGLLPYAIAELQWKIASSWSTLNAYERHPERVTDAMVESARENVVFHMGIISHFVGDGAQPLHITVHHHGWVGKNPKGYNTEGRFHQYIDGGVLELHGLTRDALPGPARPPVKIAHEQYWPAICGYLYATFEHVEPLYELDRTGALRAKAGKDFIEDRLLEGGAMLAGVWIAAREGAVVDDYMERKLTGRMRQPASAPAATATGK